MGFLANLFSGGRAAEVVTATAEGVGGLAKDIRTAITGIDPDHAAELEKLALEADRLAMQAQADINKAEAGHSSLFVAGWRPALGWLFGMVLGLHYLVRPIADWILRAAGSTVELPQFDLSAIWPVLIGMLGLGLYRTVEKAQGVQGHH